MTDFTKRHFRTIANVLKETKAPPSQVKAFERMFKMDNPQFNPKFFENFIKTGKERKRR